MEVGALADPAAHLDGAASELVVKSGHHVEVNKAAIAEVKRILQVHAKEVER